MSFLSSPAAAIASALDGEFGRNMGAQSKLTAAMTGRLNQGNAALPKQPPSSAVRALKEIGAKQKEYSITSLKSVETKEQGSNFDHFPIPER